MPITRKFLDWQTPALSAAVDHFVERYRTGNAIDLRNVVAVVPGARAGRRLLEILV